MPARRHPVDPDLGLVESLGVRETAGGLDGQLEPVRQPAPPPCEGRLLRPAVEAAIELDRMEPLAVVAEAVAGSGSVRIEHALPVVVAPARRSYQNDHDGCLDAEESLTRRSSQPPARAASPKADVTIRIGGRSVAQGVPAVAGASRRPATAGTPC